MFKKVSGQRIKKAIKDAGYTQEEFAKKIGLSNRSMISQWIVGAYNPSSRYLEKIADATGKPFDYFFAPPFNSAEVNGNGNIVNTGQSQTVINSSDITSLKKDNELLKKDMEILKLQVELLKKDKKK
jgi:transcriptional regulator with XRE-family HTH domain